MSDTNRKVFPVESVLALVAGKGGADIREIAGYVAGRSLACDCCARAAGPFAAAWLARLYPKFSELEWKEDMPWEAFVAKGRSLFGDNVSLTPMDGRVRAVADQALDFLADSFKNLQAQTAAAVELEGRVRVLEPLEAKAAALQKKCDALEDKIKSMNTDLGGLRKQVAGFQGKVAVDHDELMRSIKDAIKDGLKGFAAGGVAAGAAAAAGDGENAPAGESGVPDDFGFGASGADNDGFGF
ncbi:MAG: hypothetical protein LBQ10_07050 [Desulfovibrio sp.]|jgi:hypothetical protein|nr:hypothetical protein [Desulfovibrio sp.]